MKHAFKTNWIWELPFGQGRRFASNAPRVMDVLLGGWTVSGESAERVGQRASDRPHRGERRFLRRLRRRHTAEALREAVAKACSFATHTAEDPYAGLADASLMATDPPDLDLSHVWALDSAEAIRLAVSCEDAARSYDERISNSEGATVATSAGARAYGNSHGFVGGYRKTSHSISCVVVGEANGEMERDYHYSTARDAGELESVESIGQTAAQRIDVLVSDKAVTAADTIASRLDETNRAVDESTNAFAANWLPI